MPWCVHEHVYYSICRYMVTAEIWARRREALGTRKGKEQERERERGREGGREGGEEEWREGRRDVGKVRESGREEGTERQVRGSGVVIHTCESAVCPHKNRVGVMECIKPSTSQQGDLERKQKKEKAEIHVYVYMQLPPYISQR